MFINTYNQEELQARFGGEVPAQIQEAIDRDGFAIWTEDRSRSMSDESIADFAAEVQKLLG